MSTDPILHTCFHGCGVRIWRCFGEGTSAFHDETTGSPIKLCPGCVGPVHAGTVLTPHGMEQLQLAARERAFQGGPLTDDDVAALTAETEEGRSFDDTAALYARTPDELRAALAAFIAAQTPAPTLHSLAA